jgi:chemotaxis protein MotB
MADGDNKEAGAAKGSGSDGGDCPPAPKCPECKAGLPAWMATFSDLVTLLLTFFVLLLSFAKTETAKYQAALGSIRNALGGNTMEAGKVMETGKSPDDAPTMIDSQFPSLPFPIDFKTTDGILDKREINRESDESVKKLKQDAERYDLQDAIELQYESEGIKMRFKENLLFDEGSFENITKVNAQFFTQFVKMLRDTEWVLFVEGHADIGEKSKDGSLDALGLSAQRALEVARSLMRQGVPAERISTVFYGDFRPIKFSNSEKLTDEMKSKAQRRVEFVLRKKDLTTPGKTTR